MTEKRQNSMKTWAAVFLIVSIVIFAIIVGIVVGFISSRLGRKETPYDDKKEFGAE